MLRYSALAKRRIAENGWSLVHWQVLKIGQFTDAWGYGPRQLVVFQGPIDVECEDECHAFSYSCEWEDRRRTHLCWSLSTDKRWRLVNSPMEDGMGPVNWLLSKCLFVWNMKMSVMLLLFLQREGSQKMVHQFLNRIALDLWSTDKYSRLIKSPTDEGMGPVSWLFSKDLFTWNMKMSVIAFSCSFKEKDRRWWWLTIYEDWSSYQCNRVWTPPTGCYTESYSWEMRMSVTIFSCSSKQEVRRAWFTSSWTTDRRCTDQYWRLVNSPMDEGIGPVNWLWCKDLWMRDVKISAILFLVLSRRCGLQMMVHQFLKHISSEPWSTDKNWRLVSSPMDKGTCPVNWLLYKYLFTISMNVRVMLSSERRIHLFRSPVYLQVLHIGQFANGWGYGSRQLIVVQIPIQVKHEGECDGTSCFDEEVGRRWFTSSWNTSLPSLSVPTSVEECSVH